MRVGRIPSWTTTVGTALARPGWRRRDGSAASSFLGAIWLVWLHPRAPWIPGMSNGLITFAIVVPSFLILLWRFRARRPARFLAGGVVAALAVMALSISPSMLSNPLTTGLASSAR